MPWVATLGVLPLPWRIGVVVVLGGLGVLGGEGVRGVVAAVLLVGVWGEKGR